MSKAMRANLKSFDIVHPNFSLKVALFFSMSTNIIVINKTKIHYVNNLDSLYEDIESDQKTFILGAMPSDVRLYDCQLGTASSSYVDSSHKVIKKVINYSSEEKYRDFDTKNAIQTCDIMGKHISEFKRAENDTVPEVFHLLFNYFEENEEYIKREGVFRLAANKDLLDDINTHMKEGDYDFLASVDDPLTVAVYLKKVFGNMGEPICTFELYTRFKDINDENCQDLNEKIEMANELLNELPTVNRDTFKALLNFLYMFTEYGEFNKMKSKNMAIVFAPNLFRAYEVTPNDMIYAQVMVKTLEIMIDY